MNEEVRKIIMDAIIKYNMYQFKSDSYKFINELTRRGVKLVWKTKDEIATEQ